MSLMDVIRRRLDAAAFVFGALLASGVVLGYSMVIFLA